MEVLTYDEVFAMEVIRGLTAHPKTLPTRYIYDDRGSKLFEQIMQLPEYYLTRCETEILRDNAAKVSEMLDTPEFNLVELGAGNGAKTKLLLSHFIEENLDFIFVPIDISEKALEVLDENLKEHLPAVSCKGLVMEYFDGLNWLKEKTRRRNLVLFLGSNIGNLDAEKNKEFLTGLHDNLNDGDLVMIGFDLVKDYRIIERAYNDSSGVTKAFVLNLLARMNRELGADFNLGNFDYHNFYNPNLQANEAYIVSRKKQSVHFAALDKTILFDAWEHIHTEYSFKYTPEQIHEMASPGFEVLQDFFDEKGYFCDSVWRVRK